MLYSFFPAVILQVFKHMQQYRKVLRVSHSSIVQSKFKVFKCRERHHKYMLFHSVTAKIKQQTTTTTLNTLQQCRVCFCRMKQMYISQSNQSFRVQITEIFAPVLSPINPRKNCVSTRLRTANCFPTTN